MTLLPGSRLSTDSRIMSSLSTSKTDELPDVGFVACIESGVLEAQATLLFESIRRYGGRFRNCPVYAVSPRRGYPISIDARKKLADLGVHFIDTILNRDCPEYGSANRVFAAAYRAKLSP